MMFETFMDPGSNVSIMFRKAASRLSPIKPTNLSSGRLLHNSVCETRCWSVSLPVVVRSSYKIYAHVHSGYFTGNYMQPISPVLVYAVPRITKSLT